MSGTENNYGTSSTPINELDTLRQKLIELEQNQTRLLAQLEARPNRRIHGHDDDDDDDDYPDSRVGRRPDPFKGTKADKDSRRIDNWLDRMDTYWRIVHVRKDTTKIDLMRGFLTDAAGTEYDNKIKESGAFTTYQNLKDWLIAHYSTSDPINTYRDRFFNCVQGENESFDDYFQRFRDARSTLDTPLPETYVVYFFVRQLLPLYFQQIRGDKEFSEYKNITLDDVLAKLKRTNAKAVFANTTRREQNTTTTSAQSGHDNRNSNPKRRRTDYQQTNTPRTQQPTSTELTDGQKRFVDAQVKRGGGNQFFENVQNNSGWRAQAKQSNLCFKCASPHHHSNSCDAPLPPLRQNTGSSVGNLNSLIPEEEIDYLNYQRQS
jgi:Retrotransposon gag protein